MMSFYDCAYTTLARVKSNKEIATANDDSMLLEFIDGASRMIERYAHRVFYPYYASLQFEVRNKQLILLTSDLLTSTDTTLDDYTQLPLNRYPKTQLASSTIPTGDTITIAGTYGFHNNPIRMFRSVSTLDGALDDSTTSVVLASAVSMSYPNIISVDDEYMYVTGESAETLTVERGANGTTASAHDTGATVKLFHPVPDIATACTTLALYLYETRDNFGEQVASMDGVYTVSKVMPATIASVLDSYFRYANSWDTYA